MGTKYSMEDYWLDPNGNKLKVLSYNFRPLSERSACVLYCTLSNGEVLPMEEVRAKYRRLGWNYLDSSSAKPPTGLLNE